MSLFLFALAAWVLLAVVALAGFVLGSVAGYRRGWEDARRGALATHRATASSAIRLDPHEPAASQAHRR